MEKRPSATDNSALNEALRTAEQMEIDGKAYYLKLAETSSNQRGRAMYRIMAEEEEAHQRYFRDIHAAIKSGRALPRPPDESAEVKRLAAVFSQSVANLEPVVEATATELEAIDTALRMEEKGISFYRTHFSAARDPLVRKFYDSIVNEERRHHATLLEYRRYILDPDGWVVSKSRPVPGTCFTAGAEGGASECEW